jgi:ubiquinone/menaquinone biosynthesis C-methylase UbiE
MALSEWFKKIFRPPQGQNISDFDSSKVIKTIASEDYGASFGRQWNHFSKTQVDGFNQLSCSADRFSSETGWSHADLNNQVVLDAGCGSGRFSEIAIRNGANVISFDLSSAVNACIDNLNTLGFNQNQFVVLQGSLDNIPLEDKSVDKIFCLGVIQHCSDRKNVCKEFARIIKPGGEVCFWAYERSLRGLIGYKYPLRLITKKLETETVWKLSKILTSIFFPLGWALEKIPLLGRLINRVVLPIAYRHPAGSSYLIAYQWTLLDTFDNLAPKYDSPVVLDDFSEWFAGKNVKMIKRLNAPGLAVKIYF